MGNCIKGLCVDGEDPINLKKRQKKESSMKNTATVLALALGLAAATHTPAPAHYGADAAPTDAQVSVAENAGSELLGPHWSVGDEWIVETETRSEQYAKGNEREVVWSKPVRWKFIVEAVEQIDDKELLKASIICLEENPLNPKLAIWLDSDSGVLVRLESTSTFGGKERTFEETYVGEDGDSPVLGTIPALPLDIPFFKIQKGPGVNQQYSYSTFQGKPTKTSRDLVFFRRIEQSVEPNANDQTGVSFRITLKSGSDYAIQIWNPGKPWASFGDNGTTRFRLVEDDDE
jgi:hypothetical protein